MCHEYANIVFSKATCQSRIVDDDEEDHGNDDALDAEHIISFADSASESVVARFAATVTGTDAVNPNIDAPPTNGANSSTSFTNIEPENPTFPNTTQAQPTAIGLEQTSPTSSIPQQTSPTSPTPAVSNSFSINNGPVDSSTPLFDFSAFNLAYKDMSEEEYMKLLEAQKLPPDVETELREFTKNICNPLNIQDSTLIPQQLNTPFNSITPGNAVNPSNTEGNTLTPQQPNPAFNPIAPGNTIMPQPCLTVCNTLLPTPIPANDPGAPTIEKENEQPVTGSGGSEGGTARDEVQKLTPIEKRKLTLAKKKAKHAAQALSEAANVGNKCAHDGNSDVQGSGKKQRCSTRTKALLADLAAGGYVHPTKGTRK
ncbi:hypothetical protein Moror_15618 [Moniliophthora roreri MCA 2997]|uniref:Uncharacterized protein n=1 Tax=Moniliophthora roreri (strain MCA 2997) TaxID=1381753 RepID=V2W9C4_MONRO|nr:hypothetical protein Moror_15618 [Moniliophthora roreri MCA 2997]